MERWTEALAEDLHDMAQLAMVQQRGDDGFPSVVSTEADRCEETAVPVVVLFSCAGTAGVATPPTYLAWSWPAMKAGMLGFLRTWPAHAPLMP